MSPRSKTTGSTTVQDGHDRGQRLAANDVQTQAVECLDDGALGARQLIAEFGVRVNVTTHRDGTREENERVRIEVREGHGPILERCDYARRG